MHGHRWRVIAWVACAACGPASGDPPAEGSSTGTSTSDAASTGPSSTDADTTTTSTGASESSSADASSSTGEPWTYPSGTNASNSSCNNGNGLLLIELYDEVVDACIPPVEISEGLVMLGIRQWEGESGTFDVSLLGPGFASIGTAITDESSGTLSLIVDAPWMPSSVTYDIVVDGVALSGTADLFDCFHPGRIDACAD